MSRDDSRNGSSATVGGRINQKARTRAALVDAAIELVREGQQPSIPEVADRALISVATAYRYFASAEALWFEASETAISYNSLLEDAQRDIDAAGDDLHARIEAAVRTVGFAMVDDQAPYRRLAQAALERWFDQIDASDDERVPVREARRNRLIAMVIDPLRDQYEDSDIDRVAHVLTTVLGTEAMISLTDSGGLEGDEAKAAMLDAARWMIAGALAELGRG